MPMDDFSSMITMHILRVLLPVVLFFLICLSLSLSVFKEVFARAELGREFVILVRQTKAVG